MLRVAPALLALVVLGAHFYRAGEWLALALVTGLLALAAIRRRWVRWLIQAALALGAIEWVRTLTELVAVRQSLGMPWIRLSAILGGVAIATLLSALVFRSRRVRAYYDASSAHAPAAAPDAAPDARATR